VLQIGIRFALRGAGIKEAVAIKEHKYAPRHAGNEMNVYILSRSLASFVDRFHAPSESLRNSAFFLFSVGDCCSFARAIKISHIGDRV
jgi:hypothetical protein